jgi:hypothetical protein
VHRADATRQSTTAVRSTAAAAACSREAPSHSRPTRRAFGRASRRISMRFPANSSWLTNIPVALPPGRDKLAT